jgi:hypothetical protein
MDLISQIDLNNNQKEVNKPSPTVEEIYSQVFKNKISENCTRKRDSNRNFLLLKLRSKIILLKRKTQYSNFE